MVAFAHRVRTVLPQYHVLVDIDDEDAMKSLLDSNGDLRAIRGRKTSVQESTAILLENLARRDLPR